MWSSFTRDAMPMRTRLIRVLYRFINTGLTHHEIPRRPDRPAAASLPAQQPAEIARIVVFPTSRSMTAVTRCDFRAEARDAQGRVIPAVTFRYRLGGSARSKDASTRSDS